MAIDFSLFRVEKKPDDTRWWGPESPEEVFPHDEWAPAIAAVANAKNFLDQKLKLTYAIAGFAAIAGALKQFNQTRATVVGRDLVDARFRTGEDITDENRLISVTVPFSIPLPHDKKQLGLARKTLGYPNPDSSWYMRAFAVIETNRKGKNAGTREVARSGSDALTAGSVFVRDAVIEKLLKFADSQNPEAHIRAQVQELSMTAAVDLQTTKPS